METTMKVPALARKLRARLVELKKERVKHLADYDKKFAAWKRETAKWLREVPAGRMKDVTKAEVNGWHRGDLPAKVMAGIPQPPDFPSDDAIKRVQKTLRYVAVTGQNTIRVSARDVEEWFGKEASE